MLLLCGAAVIGAGSASAQETGPGLVIPVPPVTGVTTTPGTYRSPRGAAAAFEVVRTVEARAPVPIVVFANGSGPSLRRMRAYRDWARLVTTRGFAGVLYDGPGFDGATPFEDYLRESVAHLDSLVAALGRRREEFGVDPTRIVIWAGSAQTATGTPYALGGERPVKGYVLYYGAGHAAAPRLDVPVFVVRAGLDAPGTNVALDSLVRSLTLAGVPVTTTNYPAGSHGFDLIDSTAMTARIIEATLDFMTTAITPAVGRAIAEGGAEAAAAAAFGAERWDEAERRYSELGERRPRSRSVAWRLGLAQLANEHPAAALESFDRARSLGQGGARDIGLPAARAALRAGRADRAAEWTRWALESYPMIRSEIAADRELAPLLEHPLVKR